MTSKPQETLLTGLAKCPTGITGLDDITGGGLPRGRPTLLCGGPGCGKTLLALEFLVRGITEFDEPGVFIAFEENPDELAQNVASLGFNLPELRARRQLAVDHVRINAHEVEQNGEFDLDALFIRLAHAIKTVGAKRLVLDTVECLFGDLPDPATLRSELQRLFRWLKDQQITAIITGERGDSTLTRHGLEEYVSDCVIALDHRILDQTCIRRLRVVKYRGSAHGTNEYPFVIDDRGFSLLPITTLKLDHIASDERISIGVPGIDAMLSGSGLYRGSSVLVSGTAGTGKTTLAAHFIDAACARGERALYFSFEESPSQIKRNLKSVGLDLAHWEQQGLLGFVSSRPSTHGLEMHLLAIHKALVQFNPAVVVVDPINGFIAGVNQLDVKIMLVRLIDFLKAEKISVLLTNLTPGDGPIAVTEVGISSIIDTWLALRDIECNGERNRSLTVIKSRGMAHSNQVREFLITAHGIYLKEACLSPAGVLTGSTRLVQKAHEADIDRLDRKHQAFESQLAALQAAFDLKQAEIERSLSELQSRLLQSDLERSNLACARYVDLKAVP